MKPRKSTNVIIFHHALASLCTIKDIDRWHREKGYECVGYHGLIRRSGEFQAGRPLRMIGAHALGRNADSIGFCFEGNLHETEPTIEQIEMAGKLVHDCCRSYQKSLRIEFHRPHVFNFFEPASYGRFDSCPGKLLDRNDFLEQMSKLDPYKVLK